MPPRAQASPSGESKAWALGTDRTIGGDASWPRTSAFLLLRRLDLASGGFLDHMGDDVRVRDEDRVACVY